MLPTTSLRQSKIIHVAMNCISRVMNMGQLNISDNKSTIPMKNYQIRIVCTAFACIHIESYSKYATTFENM